MSLTPPILTTHEWLLQLYTLMEVINQSIQQKNQITKELLALQRLIKNLPRLFYSLLQFFIFTPKQQFIVLIKNDRSKFKRGYTAIFTVK
ncbi:hypothetical protein [Rickettsiella massiliensis]|uniref:hypothetical protein n=1 Tax=Rickettsiella massiliensis TaxID=676517 RepID=UPI00029A2122|nr:hypothetical protein [Rickettsiella massiliensis]